LPGDWKAQNQDVVSFRYEHLKAKQGADEEFYFKFLEAGGKLEINALSNKNDSEIFSSEFE
jgi:hypothetical protein